MSIKFGTDGWRGVIAEDFTFDNVRICAQGTANYLKQSGLAAKGLVIGYDTRFASEDFAAAAAEVIAGNDIKVHLCLKAAPTPVVSHTIVATKSAGAIVITASHNPGAWNGFKYRTQEAASAPGEVISEIEKNVTSIKIKQIKRLPLDKALKRGILDYMDPFPAYFKQLNRLINIEELRNHELRVVVDSMYGAGDSILRMLLQDGNMEVSEINAERNPSFPGIRPEPIAKNLTRLCQLVMGQKADVGIATDGDADRIGVIDKKGNFLNQHQVFALLSLYLLETRGERGAIVKTLTSTKMLSVLGKIFQVPVYETAVGFRYVAPVMMKKNALIGGEESGGYGFRGHIPERDGILAALYFLDFMVKTGKTPGQLLDYLYSKVGPHHYDRMDFHILPSQHETVVSRLASASPETIAGGKVTKTDTTDGFRFFLADDSWLLIRLSGTEPLVRIYAEAESEGKVKELLDAGKVLAGV